jgi:hypothetical protein
MGNSLRARGDGALNARAERAKDQRSASRRFDIFTQIPAQYPSRAPPSVFPPSPSPAMRNLLLPPTVTASFIPVRMASVSAPSSGTRDLAPSGCYAAARTGLLRWADHDLCGFLLPLPISDRRSDVNKPLLAAFSEEDEQVSSSHALLFFPRKVLTVEHRHCAAHCLTHWTVPIMVFRQHILEGGPWYGGEGSPTPRPISPFTEFGRANSIRFLNILFPLSMAQARRCIQFWETVCTSSKVRPFLISVITP